MPGTRMDERYYLRIRAIELEREAGMTWAAIGRRHGISAQRASQIYREWNWDTDTMERHRAALRAKFERVV